MSLSTRIISPIQIARRRRPRVPGDPGRPLTTSVGARRILRISGSLVLLLLLILPLVPLALWSMADRWEFPSVLPTEIGLNGLRTALAQGAPSATLMSLGIAVAVAVIATPLGALAARSLVRGWAPMPRLLMTVLMIPVALPPLASVFGVNVLLLRGGIPSVVGVIGVLVVQAIPYTTFSMRVAFAAHDERFEEEAHSLGATRNYVLWHVQLPLLATALARSAFFAFLVGWNDYLITLIVGGGQIVTLPIITASLASGVGNSSAVGALSLGGLVLPLVLIALMTLGGTRRREALS